MSAERLILIVEDNAANLELMSYVLHAFGYATIAATSAEQGLLLAYEHRPRLVLCDVLLPGMDGFAFAAAFRSDQSFASTPLVAVTALAMVGDRDRILQKGFDGYISKPIDPETFVRSVESFLAPPEHAWTRRSSPLGGPAQKLATILAVDDHDVNLSLERSLFEPLGYVVVTADTLHAGLAQARATLPDLIISDVRLGADSGFDFIREAKADARLAAIPFVFLTSTHVDEVSRRTGLALGARRVLFRPIDAEVLLAEIEACLPPEKCR